MSGITAFLKKASIQCFISLLLQFRQIRFAIPSQNYLHLKIHSFTLQVSVERAFSALALILSKTRTQLSEEHLDNILLLKLNAPLFESAIVELYDENKQ